jgi:5-methyltetrahydrofolate corrinoid/iron sulfur protein methyltransferase
MNQRRYIIGDRLNMSNKAVRTAVELGDIEALTKIARTQLVNGADALDITACASGAYELKQMKVLLGCLTQMSELVVCSIDTQDPKVVSAMRGSLPAPPILNCYSGLLDSLSEMQEAIRSSAPLTAVVAVCVDFQGTNVAPAKRLDVAKRMAAELTEAGLDPDQIIFDPVTIPSSTGSKAEQVTLETIRLLRNMFPQSGVLCAVSNYSYGLTKRREAEAGYVERAKSYGANVFLLNALDKRLCRIVREP